MNKQRNYDFNAKVLDTEDIDFKKNDAIYRINRKFTISLEEMIKKYPNQYFWFHKMKNKKQYKK